MIKRTEVITAKDDIGVEFEIDWGAIKRGIETLQKLAPPDLRQPPEFLDRLYEAKRTLKKVFEDQAKRDEEEFKKMVQSPIE